MADVHPGKGESLQVRSRAVAGTMVAILILLAAIAFGLALFFPNRIGVRFVPRHPFPTPAVIPNERAERLGLEAHQRRELAGADGRLPIDRAMQQIAGRGAHAFDPVKP